MYGQSYFLFLLLASIVDKFEKLTHSQTECLDEENLFNLQIVILSAREHFEKRQTIRNTWFKHISAANQLAAKYKVSFRLNAYFILGNVPCPIHPLLREDLYDCLPKSSSSIVNSLDNKTFTLFTTNSLKINKPKFEKEIYKGFSFKISRQIILLKLAVFAGLFDHYEQINISLYDAFTKETIFKTIITKKAIYRENFYFIDVGINLENISTYILFIENEINYEDIVLSEITIEKWSPFVHIARTYYGLNDFDSKLFEETKDLLLINFEFQTKDIISNENVVLNENYSKMWFQKLEIVSQKLSAESSTFGDILFVNMTDVYRNLPEKLLSHFDKYIDAGVTHILKTDDDCYVNIFLIVELLLQHYKEKFSWFGNFREKWPVNYYGKWADQSYSSPIYPQFACGSGYILTGDLVAWLRLNYKYLHRYQGEDISMGIWMSSINPKRIQDKRWICGDEPRVGESFLSVPQLTRQAMIGLYAQCNK